VSSAPVAGAVLRQTLIGGREIGEATLVRFYLLHIIALPLAVAVLFGYHMWRVRKDGGLARGDADATRDPGDTFCRPGCRRDDGQCDGHGSRRSRRRCKPANPDVTPNRQAPWYSAGCRKWSPTPPGSGRAHERRPPRRRRAAGAHGGVDALAVAGSSPGAIAGAAFRTSAVSERRVPGHRQR
jgi:hypothetical protein